MILLKRFELKILCVFWGLRLSMKSGICFLWNQIFMSQKTQVRYLKDLNFVSEYPQYYIFLCYIFVLDISWEIMFNCGVWCFKLVLIGIHSFGAAAGSFRTGCTLPHSIPLQDRTGPNTKYQIPGQIPSVKICLHQTQNLLKLCNYG